MNKQEFTAWMEVTKFSEHHWVLDEITYHNKGILLFYKGGEDGVYFEAQKDGLVTVGEYEDAFPHIGDALFRIKHSRKVADNQDDAFKYVAEKLGVSFLIEIALGIKSLRRI